MGNATSELCSFMAQNGSFEVGEAVYANESTVGVRTYWLQETDGNYLVFDSDSDPMDDKTTREAQSWVLWVKEETLRTLLGLVEFL